MTEALCEILLLVSAGALGVFAGAMLTEGFVLVPYWRSLSPAEFFAWYRANDERLLRFFAPPTAAAALLAVAAAAVAFWVRHPGRGPALLAALLALAAAAMFPLYFQAANARFSAASLRAEELPAELARWAAWHRARMLASVAALAAALASPAMRWLFD